MKKSIYGIMALALLTGMVACQPDELIPEESNVPITSVTAHVEINGYKALEFKGIPDENHRIEIAFPYFYPEISDDKTPEDVLKEVKVTAELANNVTLTPALTYLDLSVENVVTVTDQTKKQQDYVIVGVIKKSNLCEITSFELIDPNISGVIGDGQITLASADALPKALAKATVSPHATMSPDPTKEALDYSKDVVITVTAHDGVTSQKYAIKRGIPEKLEKGMREGSAKLLFEKKLKEDLGINVDNLTTGIAVSGDYLAINTRGQKMLVINRLTGDKVKEVDLGEICGNLRNFYMTNDDAGHLFISNLAPDDGDLKIWKMKDIDSKPELYLTWKTGTNAYGRKFSIRGSTDGEAVITVPCHTNPTCGFLTWTVEGGVPSAKPFWTNAAGAGTWNMNVDICHLTPEKDSDYFIHTYSFNQLAWVSGKDNKAKHLLGKLNTNYIPNAIDIVTFNNVNYLLTNQLNSFPWGVADNIWLLDLSNEGKFTGNLEKKDVPCVRWSESGLHGPNKYAHPVNANWNGDVKLSLSKDGYYMYMYFMFCNGAVVGYQFDCLDI